MPTTEPPPEIPKPSGLISPFLAIGFDQSLLIFTSLRFPNFNQNINHTAHAAIKVDNTTV